MLSGTYFWPKSIIIENQTMTTKKVAKKEEPFNLHLAEPS